MMNFANNHLSREIPSSVGSMIYLESLHLNDNNFCAEFPSFLRNCKHIVVLDLGDNRFLENIPAWVVENFSLLKILRLRSNMFNGSIPQQFPNLLDFSSWILQIIILQEEYLRVSAISLQWHQKTSGAFIPLLYAAYLVIWNLFL